MILIKMEDIVNDMAKARASWAKDDAERQLKIDKGRAKIEDAQEQAMQTAEKTVEAAIDDAANRDPLSGASGAHPIGTGAGAAGGAAAGAALGTAFGGPAGFVVGGVAGAVIGGLAGKGAAEAVNPTDENTYWRDNYKSRPYVKPDVAYNVYQPAYQYGWESRGRFAGRAFDDFEIDLRADWARDHGASALPWEEARAAARDAWDRLAARASEIRTA